MKNFIKKIIFRKRNGIRIGTQIRAHAQEVLHEIKQADTILLHCHPSPDPDSVGSALAMKWVLEGMGKKVTVIRGDSEMPKGFMHFPGAETIVPKNILEVDLTSFDLFIAVDSASIQQISKKGVVVFPESLRVVNIDHHSSNNHYGHVNLVETTYPACAQVLYELFLEWKVQITTEVADNLFIGLYTDTIEFRIPSTSPKTLFIASKLAEHVSDKNTLISKMENSETKEHMKFVGLMISSIEPYFDNHVAIASLDLDTIQKNNILDKDISSHNVTHLMRMVEDWQVIISMVEAAPNKIKVSIRSKNVEKYDISKLAMAFGGGGHKAAAGILMLVPLAEAKKMLLSKAKELFQL